MLAGAGVGVEGGEWLVEFIGEGAGHFTGGSQSQAVAQILGGAALLADRGADEEADHGHRHGQDLQFGNGDRVVVQRAHRHDDPDLQHGGADDGAGHALAGGGPHDGQEEQVEELEAAVAAGAEGQPQGGHAEQQVGGALPFGDRAPQPRAPAFAGKPQQERHHHRDADTVANPEAHQPRPPAGLRQQADDEQ